MAGVMSQGLAAGRGYAVAVLVAMPIGLAACGGGGSGSGGGTSSGGSNKPQGQVVACARAAGLKVRIENFDRAFNETGQIGLSSIGNTITITFFKDESQAQEYYKISGGAKNPGAEPGGNEQIGKAMLAFYAKDQALRKAENCTKAS